MSLINCSLGYLFSPFCLSNVFVRFVLGILFLHSLFRFLVFVCLLSFLLCSCSLQQFSWSFINMDFLFHLLFRATIPFFLSSNPFFFSLFLLSCYLSNFSSCIFIPLSFLLWTCASVTSSPFLYFSKIVYLLNKAPTTPKQHPNNKNSQTGASYWSGTSGSWQSGNGCTYVKPLTSNLNECNYENPLSGF